MALTKNHTCKQGDDFEWFFVLEDLIDGVPVPRDLTVPSPAEILAQIRDTDSRDGALIATFTPLDDRFTEGIIGIFLDKSDTTSLPVSDYWWDIQVTHNLRTYTYYEGTFKIEKDVSNV